MKELSTEMFEEQWMAVADLPQDSMNRLMDDMASLQPDVLTYLMGSGHEVLDEDQQELLLFCGVVIWRTYTTVGRIPAAVSNKALDECEEKNGTWLEGLFNAVDEDAFDDAISEFAGTTPQADLIDFLGGMLFEEFSDAPEARAVMIIFLKTTIDCFESAS